MSSLVRPSAVLLLAACLLGAASAAQAQTAQRLEATYSTGRLLYAQSQWETPFRPGVEPDSRVIAHIAPFELRLTIPKEYFSPPRPVRIYVALPLTAIGMTGPGSLELHWQTGGRFLPGKVLPRQRALLYQGLVDAPELRDQMRFTVRVDAADVLDRLQFEPVYEIESQ
jgi:opacity protein-like surface antigen